MEGQSWKTYFIGLPFCNYCLCQLTFELYSCLGQTNNQNELPPFDQNDQLLQAKNRQGANEESYYLLV